MTMNKTITKREEFLYHNGYFLLQHIIIERTVGVNGRTSFYAAWFEPDTVN